MTTPSTLPVGVVAASLLGVIVIFQLALAAGAPWGAAAYGGRAAQDDGRLPLKYRVASAGTAVILTGPSGWSLQLARSSVRHGCQRTFLASEFGSSLGCSRSIP